MFWPLKPTKRINSVTAYPLGLELDRCQIAKGGLEPQVLTALSQCDALVEVVRAFGDERVALPAAWSTAPCQGVAHGYTHPRVPDICPDLSGTRGAHGCRELDRTAPLVCHRRRHSPIQWVSASPDGLWLCFPGGGVGVKGGDATSGPGPRRVCG